MTLPDFARALTTLWTRLPFVWYNHQWRDIEISIHQAIWFHNGKPPVPIRFILIRDVQDKFDPQALLCTDLSLDPLDILVFFKRRWQMEPTFRHVREHLGVETQRQWSDKAIARTTPARLGLFSLITVLAHSLSTCHDFPTRSAAWYAKPLPTFSDALALLRSSLWAHLTFHMSASEPDMVKVPRVLLERFTDLLAYAP
jgi:hypothetical protein